LVHFFEAIEGLKDLKKNKKLVQLLGEASLDKETVVAFLNFIDRQLSDFPSSDSILNTTDFQNKVEIPLRQIVVGEQIRNDILYTISVQLLNHLEQIKTTLSEEQIKNFKSFLKMDFFPADLRFSVAQDIANSSKTQIKNILSDPDLSTLLLAV